MSKVIEQASGQDSTPGHLPLSCLSQMGWQRLRAATPQAVLRQHCGLPHNHTAGSPAATRQPHGRLSHSHKAATVWAPLQPHGSHSTGLAQSHGSHSAGPPSHMATIVQAPPSHMAATARSARVDVQSTLRDNLHHAKERVSFQSHKNADTLLLLATRRSQLSPDPHPC